MDCLFVSFKNSEGDMISAFLKRIEKQKKANIGFSQPVIRPKEAFELADEEKPCKGCSEQKGNDEPLSSEEIKFYLEKLNQKNMETIPNSITFDSIQSFVGWYEPNKALFSAGQSGALNTLSHTKSIINMGCACKIHVRQKMADEYYKNFFIKNQATDMIPKIKEIAKVETIIFKIGQEEFLKA